MRYKIIIMLSLLSPVFCYSQKLEMIIDKVNPIIANDQHGDSIRKYFSFTYHSREATFYKHNNLVILGFFSDKLGVNRDYAITKIPELQKFSNPSSRVTSRPSDGYGGEYAVPIFDSTGIIITVNGINPENTHFYQFRVLENNKRIVLPWTQAKLFSPFFLSTKIADSTKNDDVIAYLGQFKTAYGKALTFQVRDVRNPDSINVSFSAYWPKWPPRVVGVFTFSELPKMLSIFKKQWGGNPNFEQRPDWSKDSTLLKKKTNFRNNENNLIFYLDDIVKSKDIIEYNLISGSDSTGWTVNDFDFNLIWLKNLAPGKYDLKIRYSVQRQHICSYKFTIQAAWYQTVWAKLGLAFLILLALGFIYLLWRSKNQADRLKVQSIQKQVVQTELKSIRSQFNPHFVFNALSSIQGLITKNDPENASKYLIEFSNLMRDSLKASNKEFVSITTEIKILENYLKLEKLRFGFMYEIQVGQEINRDAIEVPSLFFQPLVENAVKHGISGLQEQGFLMVSFQKAANDLIVQVADNGKGFSENDASDGFGLQLTRERIKLINQTLHDQQIELNISRIDDRTQITIHFLNWLI